MIKAINKGQFFKHSMASFDDNQSRSKILVVDTTAKNGIYKYLSPFVLGPCATYNGMVAQKFENLWQFSKVYKCHVDVFGFQNNGWYQWRARGWALNYAVRYPMGRNAKPEFSHWKGERLDYIAARKKIYAPEYARNVIKTDSFLRLERAFKAGMDVILLDYDSYDHKALGMTLADVINDPSRKMGHAFVLIMILTGQLGECLKPIAPIALME